MTKVFLSAGDPPDSSNGFDEIWSLSTLTSLRLNALGWDTTNLMDVVLPDIDERYRKAIERGLDAERRRGGALRWAPLAFQHVHWRFARYFQYRLRLENLLTLRNITQLVLGADDDLDLVHACRASSTKLGIELEIVSGKSDPKSSLLAYLAAYDLPIGVSLISQALALPVAQIYRRKKVVTFYQRYNNLAEGLSGCEAFSWRRSISLLGSYLPTQELGMPNSFIELDTPIKRDVGIEFSGVAWPGFDSFDLHALESAFSYFNDRYNAALIDRIAKSGSRFFLRSGAKRIVLNSDNTAASRLMAKMAKSAGMQVDYLPHGLIWEELSLETDSEYGANRILAWNEASACACKRLGRESEVVAHPANRKPIVRKRRLPADLANMRVLIMPPEWVGLSFGSRPDCFERDLLDSQEALNRLGITNVDVKLHNSIVEMLRAKYDMLKAIRPFMPMDFNVLDPATPTSGLYEKYDLVIIGPTTGLLEVSRSETPFVGFRAMPRKAGLLSDCQFPFADTVEALVEEIRSLDFERLDKACETVGRSLVAGKSTFDAALVNV